MKRNLIWVVMFVAFLPAAKAQSVIQVTQYSEVLPLVNPAFSGIENFTDFRFVNRSQWAKINEGPSYSLAHISGSINKRQKKSKSRYKSPYNIEQLTDLVVIPNNGLRTTNKQLFRKLVRDSIRYAVKKLDRKQRAKLSRQLKPVSSIKSEPKHGVSASLLADQQGAISSYGLNMGYALHLPIAKGINMSVGMSATTSSTQFDRNKASVLNPSNDPIYNQYLEGDFSRYSLYLNSGVNLYSERFYLGYALIKLASRSLDSGIDFSTSRVETQHNILGGLFIPINPHFMISPSIVYVYKSKSPASLQANAKVYYQDKYWVGLNIRKDNSFGANLGLFFLDKYKFSYAYDMPSSASSPQFGATHEVVLGILLSKGAAPKPLIH